MPWMKEHRSERPAVWDYSNPTAEKRVSLRHVLRSPAPGGGGGKRLRAKPKKGKKK
jgi:hypothetical protein